MAVRAIRQSPFFKMRLEYIPDCIANEIQEQHLRDILRDIEEGGSEVS